MLRILGITALSLMITGCMAAGGKFPPTSLDVRSSEVVLVGKIELVPPLSENEQELDGMLGRQMRGKAMVVAGAEFHDPQQISIGKFNVRHASEVALGDTFVFSDKRTNPYILSGAFIQTEYYPLTDTKGRQIGLVDNKIVLPGAYKVEFLPEDKVVYIGTIQYHRDSNSKITKIVVKDEYNQAQKELGARYGVNAKMKRAKLAKIKG
jgi:hypothetical protein